MKNKISSKLNSTGILQLLLDNSKEIFIVIDATLTIVIFNKEAAIASASLLKKTLAKGTSILEYALPGRADDLRLMYEEILQGSQKKYKYFAADGRIFLFNFLPIYDSGIVKFISLTCTDITTEENALLQIARSQDLMHRAEKIAHMGSWEWDIETDTVEWSDGLYRFMGLEPGEIKATTSLGFSFIHPDNVDMVRDVLNQSFKTGEPFISSIRLNAKDGQLKYVFCQGIVLRNEKGRNEKFICTFQDVTAKKLLQDSIQKKDQRFKALIENSSDIVLQVNEKREIIYASPSINLIQFSSDEVTGKRLATLAYHEDLPWLLVEFEKILQDPGVPYILQYRVNKKDGTFLWVEGTITNMFHIPGVNSIVFNQRDISQRKEADRLLIQLNETLSSKALKLSSSNIELERFAYIASHDLQEPLRMITSFLQLLKKKYEQLFDEKALQYIHFAVNGAERMKKLINDLLEYSRTGSMRGSIEKLNMNEIVNNVSLIFKDELEETKGVLLCGHLPDVVAERTQMIQIFQNLVGNAIKYRGEEPPFIQIKGAENIHEYIFSIEDNGIGIPSKFSEEVFNIFQRLHGKKEYEGTGIGLAICKKIVEAHGGTIWNLPAEKQGSVFHFSIKKNLNA